MQIKDLNGINSLTAMIVGEAGGEKFTGKIAVACVVRNRVRDPRWPDTYKEVIWQQDQFSCLNDVERTGEIDAFWVHRYFVPLWRELWWRECRFAAWGCIRDWYDDITSGANHYYAWRLIKKPGFLRGHEPVYSVGGHKFYKL